MPKCPFCAEPVPLGTAHILAADIVLRYTNEFLLVVLPILEADDRMGSSNDREEKLMTFVRPLQDAIDNYTELRLGCATRVDIGPSQAPCICVFKDGERFQHPECFTFHKDRAVGIVKNPLTLEVQRGWSGDCPPAPITERSVHHD